MSRKSACVCCEEEDDLDNINFITMSESGKPIWARRRRRRQQQRDDDEDHDDDSDNDNDCTKCSGMSESQLLRVCGLVQALRASLLCHETSLQLGDIQSVQSESHSIVFLTVDSITLLAIAKRRRYHHHHHKGGSPLHVLDDTEAFLRLQLEYIFAQIMFMVTEQIQDMFRQNPSLDLRHVWGAHSDRLLDDLVDKISTTNGGNNNNNNNNPAPFFTMAVETVFPLSAATRERLSSILQEQTTDNENNNTLYAILFSGSSSNNNNNNNKPKLVTLVQPSIRQHQLRVADLHLLLHFLTRQMESHAAAAAAAAATPSSSTTAAAAAADLWLPLCLPHLHAGGFIYSYTHAIPVTLPLESSSSTTTTTSVTLALLSAQGTTEQFQTFRQMAAQIERSLGLTAAPAATASSRTPSVLEISGGTGSSQQQQQDHHHPSATVPTSSAKDANAPPSMTRSHLHVSSMHSSTSSMDNGDDYVDASGEGDRIIPYLPDEREEQSRRQLLQELSQALHIGGVTVRNNDVHHNHDALLLLDTYLNLAQAWHFLFRLNVPIRSSSEGRTIGHLPQCLSALSSSSSSFFQDSKDDNGGSNSNNNNNDSMTTMTTTSTTTTRYTIMWKAYQRLNLRLRLGSSGSEACDDAFDMIQHDLQNDHQKKKQSNSSSSSRRHHYHHHHHLKQNPTIGKHCPAMGLLEAPPNLEGVTYLTVGENTYFAMGGRDFELYLSTRSSIPSEEVAASAARLARRLLQDQEKLFVLKLLTWREI